MVRMSGVGYDVQIQTVKPHLLAAVQGIAHGGNLVPQLFQLLDKVWKFLKANPAVKNEGLNVFLYNGEPGNDLLHNGSGLPVVAGVIVPNRFPDAGELKCLATPAGRVTTVTHIGPYEKLPEVHAAVRDWCQSNRRKMAGPSWELYGHWNEDVQKLRTDIFYLLDESIHLDR